MTMKWRYEDDPEGYAATQSQAPGDIFTDPFAIQRLTDPEYMRAWAQATNPKIDPLTGRPYLVGRPLPSNWAPTQPAPRGNVSMPGGGFGGGGSAASNANAAVAANAAKGASGLGVDEVVTAGIEGAAARAMKDKLIDAIPLLAGALFGSQGPFGSGRSDGMGGQSAELESILQLMKQRMQAQGPLFTAVNQGAYNLLPNSAKQGGMFTLPSSTGAGY